MFQLFIKIIACTNSDNIENDEMSSSSCEALKQKYIVTINVENQERLHTQAAMDCFQLLQTNNSEYFNLLYTINKKNELKIF